MNFKHVAWSVIFSKCFPLTAQRYGIKEAEKLPFITPIDK